MAMPKKKAKRVSSKIAAKERSASSKTTKTRTREYLTPAEVAEQLLVATVTVRLWASKGLLPSVTTLGGHRRFRAQDVAAFVARLQSGHATQRPPARVLIIDDDRRYSRFVVGVIATHAAGALVDVAHDGFTAGVKCEAIRPDVVALDLQMRHMDGFQVCAMLRSMFGKSKLRIVALTRVASPDNAGRIIAAGADACVAKSAPVELLLREMGLRNRVQ